MQTPPLCWGFKERQANRGHFGLSNCHGLRTKVSNPDPSLLGHGFWDRISHLAQAGLQLNTLLPHLSTRVTSVSNPPSSHHSLGLPSHISGRTLFPHPPQIWSSEATLPPPSDLIICPQEKTEDAVTPRGDFCHKIMSVSQPASSSQENHSQVNSCLPHPFFSIIVI